ncbi:MAG: hypothetical protein IKO31_08485 [Bacteroidales bacterium]|nr:hypothetical protein [Bacteroidales bacterium]
MIILQLFHYVDYFPTALSGKMAQIPDGSREMRCLSGKMAENLDGSQQTPGPS